MSRHLHFLSGRYGVFPAFVFTLTTALWRSGAWQIRFCQKTRIVERRCARIFVYGLHIGSCDISSSPIGTFPFKAAS